MSVTDQLGFANDSSQKWYQLMRVSASMSASPGCDDRDLRSLTDALQWRRSAKRKVIRERESARARASEREREREHARARDRERESETSSGALSRWVRRLQCWQRWRRWRRRRWWWWWSQRQRWWQLSHTHSLALRVGPILRVCARARVCVCVVWVGGGHQDK